MNVILDKTLKSIKLVKKLDLKQKVLGSKYNVGAYLIGSP